MLLFNVFGTAGVVHASGDRADLTSGIFKPDDAGYSHPWRIDVDSVFGAQVIANIASQLSATVQLSTSCFEGAIVTLISRIRILAVSAALALAGTTATADVVAIVSVKSSITTLSKPQMADIFLGRVSRFPNGSHAVPIDQVEGSAAREEFYAKLAGRSAAQMKAYWSKIIFTGRGQPPKEVSDSAAIKKQIAEDAAAIGYLDRSQVDDSVRVIL